MTKEIKEKNLEHVMGIWEITDKEGCYFDHIVGSLNEAMQRASEIAREKGTECVVRDCLHNRLAAVPDSDGNLVPVKAEKFGIGSGPLDIWEHFEGTLKEALKRASEVAQHCLDLGQPEEKIVVCDTNYVLIAVCFYLPKSGFYSDWIFNNRLMRNNGDGTYTTIAYDMKCRIGEQTIKEWVKEMRKDGVLIPIDYGGEEVTPDKPKFIAMNPGWDPKMPDIIKVCPKDLMIG